MISVSELKRREKAQSVLNKAFKGTKGTDGENFPVNPNRVLMAHTEWLLGVRLKHSVPPVQHMKIVRVLTQLIEDQAMMPLKKHAEIKN